MTHLPFQKPRTMLGVPNYNGSQFVVVGAPTDGATSFRSGTRLGPGAIRDASLMLTDGVHEQWPVDLPLWVSDAGDMALPTGDTQACLAQIQELHRSFGLRHLVTLGGDHSITLGILRSLVQTRGPMAVVHFDAHHDTWPNHWSEAQGHGTWLRDAIEEGLVDPTRVMSIGLRGPSDPDSRAYLANHGGVSITARQAQRMTPLALAEAIRSRVGDHQTYLSLDIDCLDPSAAPGTGTPEIGGLTSGFVSELLDGLDQVNWCGMDVVEVAPAYDLSQITALAAATFVWQYLSLNVYNHLREST